MEKNYEIEINRIIQIERDLFRTGTITIKKENGEIEEIRFMENYFDGITALAGFEGKTKNYRTLEELIKKSRQ